jgi:hypothetical protein
MAIRDASSRLLPVAEELLDNNRARENLREGGEKLREVYRRAQKRRVKPTRDRKLRHNLRDSLLGSARALGEEISSGSSSDSNNARAS